MATSTAATGSKGSAANDASCADGVVESHEFAGATAFCGAAAWTLWPRASIPPFNANASDEAASEADLCAETNAFSAAHYGASADTDDASRADDVFESHESAGSTAFYDAAAQTLWSRARYSLWCQSERTASILPNADSANEDAAEADLRADANAFAADAAKMVSDAPRMGMRRRA